MAGYWPDSGKGKEIRPDNSKNRVCAESGHCVPIGQTIKFNVIGQVIGQSVQYPVADRNTGHFTGQSVLQTGSKN